MSKEIFKDIEGYEGLYKVSDKGNVLSLSYNRTGVSKILKGFKDTHEYLQVKLSRNGVYKVFFIHRLVLLAFVGKPIEDRVECKHKNLVRGDNRLENLEWVTRSENMHHADKKGNEVIKQMQSLGVDALVLSDELQAKVVEKRRCIVRFPWYEINQDKIVFTGKRKRNWKKTIKSGFVHLLDEDGLLKYCNVEKLYNDAFGKKGGN